MERRFIEESFPIKEISIEATKDKHHSLGHISSLHLWWARRPLASSRASIFAALIPYTENQKWNEDIKKEIFTMSKWDNSLNQNIIQKIRKKILDNNKGIPKILDPFSGGGAIPLEALRLGCDVYACDYNPVAVLIEKAVLEQSKAERETIQKNDIIVDEDNKIIQDMKKWCELIITKSFKELTKFYPKDADGSIPIAYFWSRVVPCQNPKCGADIPLFGRYWLSNKKNSPKVALYPFKSQKTINFKIVGDEYEPIPKDFDPSKGSIKNAHSRCPICGSDLNDGETNRKLFKNGNNHERLICVVLENKDGKKWYRLATKNDVEIFNKTKQNLNEKNDHLKTKWGLTPIPNEELVKTSGNQMATIHYGLTRFGDLFNSRQQLTLLVFANNIRDSYSEMIDGGLDKEYAKVIVTYLSLLFDQVMGKCNSLSRWNSIFQKIEHPFARPAIPMIWDYVESNPFSNFAGGWKSYLRYCIAVIDHISKSSSSRATVKMSSATSLDFPNNYFDAVITDPPYYDNILYSNLSDFFYVWQKRILGDIYPELFSTPLTPKSNEIVMDSIRHATKEESKKFFEEMLEKSFKEINRVLKNDGIGVIVYAHKSTEGWETLINSILNSGLIVTAAWPIHTELKHRMGAQETASLASSIYMVVRKWNKELIGFYRDVKKELKQYLNKKLEYLWNEGISGADFFISAIGSAIEVYGKYEKVVDDSDKRIPVLILLNDTRKIVTDYTINKVIKGEFSDEISQMTRFYILWRWAYGEAKVPFDDALKMAQSVGIDLEHEWNKGFIVKDKEFIRILGPDQRIEKEFLDCHDLIDIIHKTLLIWKKEKREDIDKFLEEKGYKNSEVLKRVAQAISESLPQESTEKKWLDGFLTGFKSSDSQMHIQSKLDLGEK